MGGQRHSCGIFRCCYGLSACISASAGSRSTGRRLASHPRATSSGNGAKAAPRRIASRSVHPAPDCPDSYEQDFFCSGVRQLSNGKVLVRLEGLEDQDSKCLKACENAAQHLCCRTNHPVVRAGAIRQDELGLRSRLCSHCRHYSAYRIWCL